METIGLSMVMKAWGFWLGCLSVIVWGIVAGWLGFFLAKKEERKEESVTLNIFIFGVFLSFFWSYLCSWAAMKITYLPVSIISEAIMGGLFVLFAVIVIKDEDGRFLHKSAKNKAWITFFSSVVVVFAVVIVTEASPTFLSLTTEEMRARTLEEIFDDKDKDVSVNSIAAALRNAEWYAPVSSYHRALAFVRMEKGPEAAKHFVEYAETQKQESKKKYWLAIASYYAKDFSRAASLFTEIGEYHMALISRYKNPNEPLDYEVAAVLAKQSYAMKDIIAKIMTKISGGEKSSDSIQQQMMEQLERLEKIIESQAKKERTPIPQAILSIKTAIESAILAELITNRPDLPSKKTESEVIAALFVLFLAWPLFCGVMFGTNMLIRDYRLNEYKWWRKTTNVFYAVSGKVSWHSFVARRIAVRLALLEKEKGMFSEEIGCLQKAVFPADAALALWYLARAKRAAAWWRVYAQEKEDISAIYGGIKRLSGKLIPQGDEKALAVIDALRKRAEQVAHAHLKKSVSYAKARGELIGCLQQLVTVGDILGARHRERQCSYYTLLGLDPQVSTDEIKKAYRSVMRAVHPDLHQGNKYMEALTTMVNVAHATLNNHVTREVYDIQMGF